MTSLFLGLCLAAALLFAGTWLVGRRLRNYGIVDVVWSLAFAPAAVGLALARGNAGPRQWLMAAAVSLWSLRLGGFLAARVLSHLDVEDARYVRMRVDWAPRSDARMLLFYAQQAVALVLLCLPMVAVMADARTEASPFQFAGAVVFLLALAGESASDAQLAAFKRDARPGAICDRGLWSWTRHPNYFCEWLVWVGFTLLAASSPWGGLFGLGCVGAMYHLLRNVTGVPLLEEHLRRSRGAAFEAHCRRVPSAFWPRWPRAEKLRGDGAPVE
jgi:steroid 5-alpha reductase family enzyme